MFRVRGVFRIFFRGSERKPRFDIFCSRGTGTLRQIEEQKKLLEATGIGECYPKNFLKIYSLGRVIAILMLFVQFF